MYLKQMIIKDQTVTRLGSHNTSSRPGHRYNREREVTDVPKRSRQELTSRLKPLAPPLSQLYKIKDNIGGLYSWAGQGSSRCDYLSEGGRRQQRAPPAVVGATIGGGGSGPGSLSPLVPVVVGCPLCLC